MNRKEDSLKFYDIGFHGDQYLLTIMDIILNDSDYFIETGTNVGSTVAYVVKNSQKYFVCHANRMK